MGLTGEQWEQIEALLPEALELAPGERQRFLDRQCPQELRGEIEAMIAASEATSGVLNRPVAVTALEDPGQSLAEGEVLGSWRIGSLLGTGGMGEVYAAERADGSYEQRVAIKLLKRGIDTQAVLGRFLRERRILARLAHPNIARLLDAGAAPDGRPYLVMERVDGLPIDRWCEQPTLTLRQRLELMCQVCEAVYAAHREQIVHRDLKPSNVLVTETGEAKLLDFGVSKLAGEDNADLTQTALGIAPLTPDYAAPEQLLGQPVTPATDVYALGLLLYRLLTGTLPHSRSSLAAAVTAAGKEDRVTRPSLILRQKRTGADPKTLRGRARELDGDLDQIVLKSVQRDPARRYASAAELADDLHRHLDGRPVLARPDSRWYVARKFIIRNLVPVSAAAAVALALIVGLTVALWQARIAERRADELRTVVDFQSDMLKRINVSQVGAAWLDRIRAKIAATMDRDHPLPPAQATAALATFDQLRDWAQSSEVARETFGDYLLAPERAEIARRFGNAPLTEARLRSSLGAAYDDLGDFSDAIAEMRHAVDLQTAALGADHPDTLATRLQLASALGDSGDTNAAAGAQAVYDIRRRVLGSQHRDTLAAENVWAGLLALHGAYDQALALLEPLLGVQQQRFGREDADSVATELQLASTLSAQGQFENALRHAQEVFAIRRRVLGNEDPLTLRAMDEIIFCLSNLSRYEDARKLAEEQLAIRRRVLGDDHPDTLKSLSRLSVVIDNVGNRSEILRLKKQVYEGYRRVLGAEHPLSMSSAINYGITLRDRGEFDAALAIFKHVVAVRTRLSGAEHPRTLNAMFQVGLTLDQKQDYSSALPLLRQVLDTERRVIGPDNPVTINAWYGYGTTLYDSGDNKDALAELKPLYETTLRVLGPHHFRTLSTQRYIALARRDLGETEAALGLLQAAFDEYRKTLGEQSGELLSIETDVAETLHRLHRDAEAQSLAGAVVDGWRGQEGEKSHSTIEAERALAGYDEALGQLKAAHALRQKADAAETELHAQSARDQASD